MVACLKKQLQNKNVLVTYFNIVLCLRLFSNMGDKTKKIVGLLGSYPLYCIVSSFILKHGWQDAPIYNKPMQYIYAKKLE